MLAPAFGILGFLLFVAMVAGLYIWTRRTESDMDFEQASGLKSDEQANALRLGIAINGSNSNVGGH